MERYGASSFGFVVDHDLRAQAIQFRLHGREVRLKITVPNPGHKDFEYTDAGRARSWAQREAAASQALRQRWRALALWVKATCEAIDTEALSVEQAFLPHEVMPNNQTFAEYAAPEIRRMIEEGKIPSLLPGGK